MNFKKITASSLLLAGIAMSPHALSAQSFHGHTVNVAFEEWYNDDVSSLLEIKNEKDVFASDWNYPDEKDFDAYPPDINLFEWWVINPFEWDIDFNQNRIELTFTSIADNSLNDGYIYNLPKVFHFHDSKDTLPEIINVRVDRAFTPPGFDPDLVTFDADNIYVNLNGSRCLLEERLVSESKPVIPACANPMSPTGFDNRITLTVEFAAEGTNDKVIIDDATIDKLYDWRESKYPELFPTHQDSMYVNGYYARFYEGTGFYIGSLKGRLYLYHIHLAVMIELGEISHLVEEMKAEMATDEMDNI